MVVFNLDFEEIIHCQPPPWNNSNNKNLSGLKILSQNTNTLNLSTLYNPQSKDKFHTKIVAILKKGADIICLQDVRIGDNIDDFQTNFDLHALGQYKCFINSNKTERGVAIMIRKSLKFKVYRQYNSLCQNSLILDMEVNGVRFVLNNIYGPLQIDCPNFYNDMRAKIDAIGVPKFLWVGDMNIVTDLTEPGGNENHNLELHEYVTIPNKNLSKQMIDLMSSGFIYDKFRLLYPTLTQYSYKSFQENTTKRSRIDQVMVSPPSPML